MLAFTNSAPLKVLNSAFAERLQVFNKAARALQAQGIRLQKFDVVKNALTITPAAALRLIDCASLRACRQEASAGSTRYAMQFQGVTLEWREPISATRPADWADTPLNQGSLQ